MTTRCIITSCDLAADHTPFPDHNHHQSIYCVSLGTDQLLPAVNQFGTLPDSVLPPSIDMNALNDQIILNGTFVRLRLRSGAK